MRETGEQLLYLEVYVDMLYVDFNAKTAVNTDN